VIDDWQTGAEMRGESLLEGLGIVIDTDFSSSSTEFFGSMQDSLGHCVFWSIQVDDESALLNLEYVDIIEKQLEKD